MKLNRLFIALTVLTTSLFLNGCFEEPQNKPAEIGIGTQTLELPATAGEATIKILSNRDWTVEVITTTETDWITVNPSSGVATRDSVEVTITVLANPNEDREATVKFASGPVYEALRVRQLGEIQKEYNSIQSVRDLYQGSDVVISGETVIKASVISNYRSTDNGGLNNSNSLQNMVVADNDAGISIRLAENNTSYALGDELEITLTGLTLQRYNNGSVQVNNVPLANIKKLGTRVLEPVSITAAQLVSGAFESRYVAVSDVQVLSTDQGKTFSNSSAHTSINFISKTGERFVIFSSKYSSFMDETVPSGSGVLKGIAAVYGTTYQISLTSTTDYAGLTGERFTESGGGGGGGGTDYSVIGSYEKWNAIAPVAEFAENFVSVTAGYQPYTNDKWMFFTSDGTDINFAWKTRTYSTDKYIDIAPYNSTSATVTAYAIFPKVNVSTANPKTLKFKLAIYYQTEDNSKLEVVYSDNFTGNASSATWTVLDDVTFPAASTTNVWNDQTVDLTSLASKTAVTIAFRYTGKSNTYRLDDVQIANGEFPEDEGGGEGGSGGNGIYTSNLTLPTEDNSGSAYYTGTVSTAGNTFPSLKLGKSSAGGSYTFPAPLPKSGNCVLNFYGVGWSSTACTLTVTINNGGTIDGAASKTFALRTNSGASGNTPFTITFGDGDFFTANLAGITSSSTITMSTNASSGPRAILTGLNLNDPS